RRPILASAALPLAVPAMTTTRAPRVIAIAAREAQGHVDLLGIPRRREAHGHEGLHFAWLQRDGVRRDDELADAVAGPDGRDVCLAGDDHGGGGRRRNADQF